MTASVRRLQWPCFNRQAAVVWYRNYLSWAKHYKSSVAMNFGEPLTNLAALGFGLGAYVAKMQGVPFVDFIAPGLLMVTAMNAVTFDMGWEAYDRLNDSRIYHGLIAAPLTPAELVGGELLWEMSRALLYGGGFFVVLLALGLVHSWWAIWLPVPLVAVGILFAAPALWVAAVARTQEQLFYYYTLVITPLFLFSGVFFPLGHLPGWVATVIRLLPLYHAVAVARGLMLGHVGWALVVHMAWVAAYAVVLTALPTGVVARRLLG
ncbi:MAG: ABC transporter permease [Actinomycetia bacterium]|nr:ABC transporter permease [Actinomycetes bacterium]